MGSDTLKASADRKFVRMSERVVIEKILTANDTGATGSHQSGIAVPKSLIAYFPQLDMRQKNPETYIEVQAPNQTRHLWRYIYYNNKLHDPNGTRNEYRLARVASFLAQFPTVRPGDILQITFEDDYHGKATIVTGTPYPTPNEPLSPRRRSRTTGRSQSPQHQSDSESEQGEFIIRKGNWRVARART